MNSMDQMATIRVRKTYRTLQVEVLLQTRVVQPWCFFHGGNNSYLPKDVLLKTMGVHDNFLSRLICRFCPPPYHFSLRTLANQNFLLISPLLNQ